MEVGLDGCWMDGCWIRGRLDWMEVGLEGG